MDGSRLCRSIFRKKWEYDVLLQDGADADLLSVLLAVAVDTCSRKSTTIHRFGRREYTTAELRTQFSKLTMSHIQYVLYSLGQTTTRIHNIRAYLLTSLYNAPDTWHFITVGKSTRIWGISQFPIWETMINQIRSEFRNMPFFPGVQSGNSMRGGEKVWNVHFVIPTEDIICWKEYIGLYCLILTVNRSEEQKMLQTMWGVGNSVSTA